VSKLYQIHEEDLAELERVMPELADLLTFSTDMDARTRVQLRKVQKILSDVRWNYGPQTDVEEVTP
jgi:phage-related protein